MSRRSLPVLLAIMSLFVVSAGASAKNEAADTITANLKLNAPTTVGTTQLPAGDYKVTVDGGKAKFQQNGKVVAEIPCTLKDSAKVNQTSFVLDNNKLIEIDVAGKSKAIQFSSGM